MSFRFEQFGSKNPSQLIIGLFIFVLAIIGVFILARSIFKILAAIAPFMLLAAAILNYKVIIEYVKTLIGWVRTNTVFGIVAIVLSVLGFPLVSLFLLLRAYSTRFGLKGKKKEPVKGEYIRFEEIDEPDLELPNREKEKLGR